MCFLRRQRNEDHKASPFWLVENRFISTSITHAATWLDAGAAEPLITPHICLPATRSYEEVIIDVVSYGGTFFE